MFGEIRKVAAVGRERVLAGAALGRQHVEIERDEPLARNCVPRAPCHEPSARAIVLRPWRRPQRFLKNLSGGIDTVISRGFGCTKCDSA